MICVKCGEDKDIHALDMCKKCYEKNDRVKDRKRGINRHKAKKNR